MPTTLTNGIQLPDKGSVDWYSSMESNYNLIDTHLGDTDIHVTAEDKANWDSKQGSLSQDQIDAIAQVATNTNDIATLQSDKADVSHTHSSSDITDIDDYATKQYVDDSISGLVDNAPDALNTLNELSAALNDDSNFASTVTTALADKANSADLATVATSGSYNDLDDLPTIPTKTSDLSNDSDFVVSSNLATIATSGDYDDLDNKPSIPTNTSDLNNDSGFVTLNDFDIPSKTSDLTNDSGFITSSDVPTSTSDLINDSNFVDTSNSAVSSGITSDKVADYDDHIADTDIHVTTADKDRWNNNTYVFRYSSTALTASSTNSNALLDNTDNLKVGDKVIDSSGVLFSITAIDTQNSTFTIGTALIDLATDGDVVHKSGDETINGTKTFLDVPITFKSSTAELGVTGGNTKIIFTDKNLLNLAGITFGNYGSSKLSYCRFHIYGKDSNNQDVESFTDYAFWSNTSKAYFRPNPNNFTYLGTENNRWAGVYATNYYYGANAVEFSTKFVTTDTNQTISGSKIFSDSPTIYNSDTSAYASYFNLKNQRNVRGSTTDTGVQGIQFQDKNGKSLTMLESRVISTGSTGFNIICYNTDGNNQSVSDGVSVIKTPSEAIFAPITNNAVTCGRALAKWSDVQTYKVNGVEPSSLSLPSDRSARIDISSYFTNTGTGDTNTYTVPANGFIYLTLSELTNVHCFSSAPNNLVNYSQTFTKANNSAGVLYVLFPVRKNDVFMATWYTTTTVNVGGAYFIPCQGNV